MIAKGNQRANGPQLAAHLMNDRDNERVELAGIDGSVARDLRSLFAEWELQAEQTKCKQFVYHLSVSPDPGQGPMTREQYLEFLDRTGMALGLGGQARGIVFHEKHGREHCHCVWSRIDVEAGRAIALSHDRQTLRRVVQEFARDYGLKLSAGLETDRGSERTGGQHTNQAEQKQQERSGQTKAERMALLTAAWQESDTAQDFVEAMSRAGFVLARGDGQQRKEGKESKPVYVVIDGAGEIHSLARQIEGAKAKEVFTRLQDGYALDNLGDARAVRAELERKDARREIVNDNQRGREIANDLGRAAGKEVGAKPLEQRQTIDRDTQDAAWQQAVVEAGIQAGEKAEVAQQNADRRKRTEDRLLEKIDRVEARLGTTRADLQTRHLDEMGAFHDKAQRERQALQRYLDDHYATHGDELAREIAVLSRQKGRLPRLWAALTGEAKTEAERLAAAQQSLRDIAARRAERERALANEHQYTEWGIMRRQQAEVRSLETRPDYKELSEKAEQQRATIMHERGGPELEL